MDKRAANKNVGHVVFRFKNHESHVTYVSRIVSQTC